MAIENPGEALWNLKAFVIWIRRQDSRNPGLLAVVDLMQESCQCLSQYIQVGLPDNNDIAARLAYLDEVKAVFMPAAPATFLPPVPSNTPARPTQPAGPCPYLPRVQELCQSILNDIASLPDRASECRDDEEKSYAERLEELATDVMGKTAANQRASVKQLEMMENRRAGMDKWLERA